MGFTKLDENFVESSLKRRGCLVVDVFTSLLSKARGDGIARISIPFLAANTWHEDGSLCSETEIEKIIGVLEAPDKFSRSLNDEGKRIRRVDGGFEIINYLKYRGKTSQDYFREYYHSRKDADGKTTVTRKKKPQAKQGTRPLRNTAAATMPPSREETRKYFAENGYAEDAADRFYNGYAAANPPWTDSQGKQIRSWKTKAQQVWFKPEHKIPPPKNLAEYEARKKITGHKTPDREPPPTPAYDRDGKGIQTIKDILKEVAPDVCAQ